MFNDTFLRACRRQPTDYTPVWYMRQAGRYMPEYRKLRQKYDMLTLTQTPELAAQITMQPVNYLGVDAAILFADIMCVPIAMGVDVKIVDSVGPIIDHPIKNQADVDKLQDFGTSEIDYLTQTIKLVRQELKVPLIGFSGAPFTLASYLIEGQPTRDWFTTKRFMYNQPELWGQLMNKLSDCVIFYLKQQIKAGAQAIQLFDSWVGCLSAADFRQYVLPYNKRIFEALNDAQVPRIIFGTDTAAILTDFASVECEVVGLDWRIDMGVAQELLVGKAIQGNLDPSVLMSSFTTITAKTDQILRSLKTRQGYIFNLGHGVYKQADPDILKRLVNYVHTH